MSSSAIAPPASTSSGKAYFRFYNSRLSGVYKSCVLPTETAFADSHTILSSTFSRATVQKSAWNQTINTPPSRSSPRTLSLSLPFLALVSTEPAAAEAANKQPRLEQPPQPPPLQPPPPGEAAEEAVEAVEPKRKAPFKRAAALDGQLRTCKVLMLPTAKQVAELKRCFAVARTAYNFALNRVKSGSRPNVIQLRTDWRQQPQPEWANSPATKVASSIQEYAIKNLVDAYRTNDAKRRLNPSHHYDVKYRSLKKNYTEVITIEKDRAGSTKKNSTLLRFEATEPLHKREGRAECLAFFGNNLATTGSIRLQDSARVIGLMVADGNRLKENAKIHWDKRSNSFHFIYTYIQPLLDDPDPQFLNKSIVATDPGSFPFHAWYSPTTGEYGELLQGASTELEDRCLALDALQSRVDKRKQITPAQAGRTSRQRYSTTRRLKKKLSKMRRNLNGWMENAHYDAANFLLSRFDIVVEPKLQVSELVQQKKRNIQSKTVRKMYTWSHYKFRERLKSAATRFAGRHVIESREPGTSKTCTGCGFWNEGLKVGEKTFCCPRCKVKVNRDVAGARNNFFSEYGRAVGVGWDGQSG